MYLKSIEVHGFKSFANKILFEFHNGITGIVGPNGSGKSNVADAVRWVLGEQSVKQLRGSSMQDVIFAGTQNRKPLGYAYVAITLDNSDHSLAIDYSEVTIARRLYRSGESEYLINGSVCRLRDVSELFYDTGIGKEGYSIIGQGQIDKILSGKPEERRELFDEAAGIVKFKRRKNETVKRLNNEKQNLVRVNDILSELEKQVGPLKNQSEKAKIYLKKKELMKTLDVNIFLHENKGTQDKLTSVTEKYTIASGQLEENRQKYNQIKVEYEQIQNEIEALEEKITKKREELASTSEVRTRLEGRIGILKEQIKAAGENEEHIAMRQKTVREQIAQKESEKQAALAEKKQYDESLSGMQEKLAGAKLELKRMQDEMDRINEEIEDGKQSIIDALNDRASLKAKSSSYDTRFEQLNIRKAELSSQLLLARTEEDKQDEVIEQLEKVFADITAEIRTMDEEIAAMEEKNGSYSGVLSELDQKLRNAQILYQGAKAKLESVSNITERYEGYDNSVRRIMEQKEKNQGIVGVVADIVKVEKKYEIAIETALGGNIKNVVTEDEETAKKMINFLKQNRFGRATFLPMTSISHPQEFKTPEVLDEKGVIGMACDLVTTDKKYKNVAKAMLGRIVVVDNQDNALKIARKYDYGIRMVTLEGELLVPGGAISGGAFKNNSNLLGRRREMDELENQIKEFSHKMDAITDEIQNTKDERNQLRRTLETKRSELQRKFIEQNTARLNVMQAQEKRNESGKGLERLKEEAQDIEIQLKEVQQLKQAAEQELAASMEMEQKVKVTIETQQKQLDDLRVKESDASILVSKINTETEVALQKQEFMQSNVDRINNEMGRIQEELEEIVSTLNMSKDEMARKTEEISQLEETIKASYTAQGTSQEELEADVARKQELGEKQKNFFGERERLAEQISSLDKETYRLNAQKDNLQQALESKINYMWDEYELTLSSASELADPEMTDLPSMKKEIAVLKDDIKKLGDVNVNAIEDYRELMKRYTFMSDQQKDLIEAEKQLVTLIEELDDAMRKQFNEKFEQISVQFDKVFKELFGGGQGTLELMEEEDVLEAGIRIIAQPPGKKLQNMMQLSGGEKALTAIALLFAIQNLKPSPFCLLDEIEAALDDSNVGRYAKYLHKLTAHTQFIVITHRRGTMESADRLYGITMQEKGVSTLVSVNLIEKDLDE